MKANEAIREVMKATGTKVSDLAFRINKKSNVISERLSQENISIKLMNEMLRAMGYKVVAVPRETRIPEGGFEVE
jgi:signal recognition particle subunit SEC65